MVSDFQLSDPNGVQVANICSHPVMTLTWFCDIYRTCDNLIAFEDPGSQIQVARSWMQDRDPEYRILEPPTILVLRLRYFHEATTLMVPL